MCYLQSIKIHIEISNSTTRLKNRFLCWWVKNSKLGMSNGEKLTNQEQEVCSRIGKTQIILRKDNSNNSILLWEITI